MINSFITRLFLKVLVVLILCLCAICYFLYHKKIKNTKLENQNFIPNIQNNEFKLLLGQSTGLMSKLWHTSSLAPHQNILLDLNDATKNILVLGGIGSGKTSLVMQPLLLQLLDQKCGGLIFDIKGDVKDIALKFAQSTDTIINLIGPKHASINLIYNLTPEVASFFLKSALLLASHGHVDMFWIDTATELCRNTLGLLSFLPRYYSLHYLYQYLFVPEISQTIEKQLLETESKLTTEQKRLFVLYSQYKKDIFDTFDLKVQSGVKATIAQCISPFNHPLLIDAFCSSKTEFNIEDILENLVFLVDMPLSVWGLGAKVAYTFIKLRFFNLMQKHHNAKNRILPVFFMCDEFQEIVSTSKDGISDINFWDKSRSSKTIGIISAQSIASFFAATSNRDYVYALLQNFRQKICLSSEDPLTIDYISSLTGNARITQKSRSRNEGYALTETLSEANNPILTPQVFRSLLHEHAISLLSIQNHSKDDILKLFPLYLSDQIS